MADCDSGLGTVGFTTNVGAPYVVGLEDRMMITKGPEDTGGGELAGKGQEGKSPPWVCRPLA
jgi:hypothetical protein